MRIVNGRKLWLCRDESGTYALFAGKKPKFSKSGRWHGGRNHSDAAYLHNCMQLFRMPARIFHKIWRQVELDRCEGPIRVTNDFKEVR